MYSEYTHTPLADNTVSLFNFASFPGPSLGKCDRDLVLQNDTECQLPMVAQPKYFANSARAHPRTEDVGAEERTPNLLYKCDFPSIYASYSGFLKPISKQNGHSRTQITHCMHIT